MKERPVDRAVRLGISARDAAIWLRVNKVIKTSYRREMGITESPRGPGSRKRLPFDTDDQRRDYHRLRANGVNREDAIAAVLK